MGTDLKANDGLEEYSIETILNSLTFNPDNSKMYSAWNFFIGQISLFQTFLYTINIAFGFQEEINNWKNVVLIIIEVIYLIHISTQFFKAYDEQGDAIYEYRFFKTAKNRVEVC